MFQLIYIHAPIFCFPFIVGSPTDAVFSADIRDGYPGFSLIEYLDDLAFAVPALSHGWLLFCLLILGTILGEPYLMNLKFVEFTQSARLIVEECIKLKEGEEALAFLDTRAEARITVASHPCCTPSSAPSKRRHRTGGPDLHPQANQRR